MTATQLLRMSPGRQIPTRRLGSSLLRPWPVTTTTKKVGGLPSRTWFSTTCSKSAAEALDRTRNIGIIAHIDAGKTTTTERMLYYSGFTRRIGDVDEGSTVTDFLPAERSRGITIQSAAITFHWPPGPTTGDENTVTVKDLQAKGVPRSTVPHTINLIDTPGHADFTFEVMRSLRILDGAVCILDGVAGVEAQTEQVWHQASTYRIPRLVYVNKLDRDGAAFGRTVREVGSRLGGWPAVCQIPWFEGGNGHFVGVADAINIHGLRWNAGGDGKSVKVLRLEQLDQEESHLAAELRRARVALVELLSEHDEEMVEKFFEYNENHMAVPSSDILASLRRCLLEKPSSRVIPVFAGASFKNIGVQPLLDAVVNLLPSPPETRDPEVSITGIKGSLQQLLSGDLLVEQTEKAGNKQKKKNPTALQAESQSSVEKLQGCSLAFKVVNDPKRGMLVYVRVYSGSLDRNTTLFNTNLNVSERVPRLLKMYANDAVEVDSVPEGHIGVVVGLKHARTGDTLVSYAGHRSTPPEPLNTLQLRPIDVPPPVFFAGVEPHSLSEEKRLQESLALLLREDPSLQVTVDEDSGQTLLSGMGELHLEIARDRLLNDLKAKASMGRIEIGYREAALGASGPVTRIFDKEIAGRKGKAGCTAIVEPFDPNNDTPTTSANALSTTIHDDNNQITILAPTLPIQTNKKGIQESPLLSPGMDIPALTTALQNGVLASLARGPQFTFPMHSTRVTLTLDETSHLFGSDSTPSALSSAARLATGTALRALVPSSSPSTPTAAAPGTTLMEPLMNVIITVDETSLGAVVHDISSSRGGHIISLDEETPLPTTDLASAPSSSYSPPQQPPEDLPPIDIAKVYAPRDPFEASSLASAGNGVAGLPGSGPLGMDAGTNRPRTITAKVPLKEMVGYLKHLRSLSAGRGTFVMSVDRFERMSAQRVRAVVAEFRGGL